MAPKQPRNRNFLSPTGYEFTITKLPTIEYFVQKVNLPGLALNSHKVGTPLISRKEPGHKLDYNELRITFAVDEDLKCWTELHDWLTGLGFPENRDQYKKLIDDPNVPKNPRGSTLSDLSLIILTSNKNANISVKFQDAFPVQLSDIEFQSTETSIEYLTAEVTFQYLLYKIEKTNP